MAGTLWHGFASGCGSVVCAFLCFFRPIRAMKLRPFQRLFIREATKPGIDTAVLSLPRGNGKSTLAAYLCSRILDPADPLFRPGTESVLLAASIKQARIVYRICRDLLDGKPGYKFVDATNRVAIRHVQTRTRLEVISSSGKSAMGLLNCPWAICDEPGSWEVNAGALMWDALTGAQGKPNSPLRILVIGTLAPGGVEGSWWHGLVTGGSSPTRYVQTLQGNPKRWDQWAEIRRCNPLVNISAEFRKKLLEERDAARRDSRLKARFLSYRLNVPSGDEAEVLLTVDDFERMTKRDVPPRQGKPIVGIDLGGNRAWSAAVACWQSGRIEALAMSPGIPSLADQEKRDHVPAGLYQKLVETGALRVAEGLRVPPVAQLVEAIRENWGLPAGIVCDRFRLPELADAAPSIPITPRVTRWSEASFDIRALRKLGADGPFAVAENSRSLIGASLAAALVKNDDAGSVRLIKRGTHNTARDDVAAALTLAAGSFERSTANARRPRARYRGMAG